MVEVGSKIIIVSMKEYDLSRGIITPIINEFEVKEKSGYALHLKHDTKHGAFHAWEYELDEVICEYYDEEYTYCITSTTKDKNTLVLNIINEFKEDMEAKIRILQDINKNIDEKYSLFISK